MIVCLTPVSLILIVAGWILAAAYVENVGKELYGDPFLYLYPSDRRGILPFILAWLPDAAGVGAASLPWIVVAFRDWRHQRVAGEKNGHRSN
jgi:hypothetical protein